MIINLKGVIKYVVVVLCDWIVKGEFVLFDCIVE